MKNVKISGKQALPPPGFQIQGVFLCLRALSPAHNGFFRFTSGATPADVLMASIAVDSFHPHTEVQVCIPVICVPSTAVAMHWAGGVSQHALRSGACIPACTAQWGVYPSMNWAGGSVCPGGCLSGVCVSQHATTLRTVTSNGGSRVQDQACHYLEAKKRRLSLWWLNLTSHKLNLTEVRDETGDKYLYHFVWLKFLNLLTKSNFKQECIPLGCVPPAC